MNKRYKILVSTTLLALLFIVLYINISNISLLLIKLNGIPFTDAAFIEAIEENNQRTIRLFLNAKIDVNANDDLPIITASMQGGNNHTIEQLLKYGADVNAISPDGHTPLMYSIMANDSECVKVLLDYDANLEMKNQSGMTALIFASWFGREEICRMLIEQGASLNEKDNEGNTAFSYAKEKNNQRLVELLASYQ